MTGNQKPKRYELACNHVLWLKIAPLSTDLLWCKECGLYEPLLLADLGAAWVYYPEWDFKARLVKRSVYTGVCTSCEFELENVYGFNRLRNLLHSHYMREHTNRGIEIKYEPAPDTRKKPPF